MQPLLSGTSRRCARPLMLLACLLLTPVLAAQETTTAESDAEEQARLEMLAAELRSQQARLDATQSEQGIYGPGLIEGYSDLGALHMALDDPARAASVYTDALQVARINDGLYSDRQLAIIDALIEAWSAMKEWAEVDDLQHLNLHISSRLHEPQEPAYLAAASDYGHWQLRLLQENLLSRSSFAQMNSAEDLSRFYDEVLEAARGNAEVPAAQLAELLYGGTRADIAIARAVAGTHYTSFTGTAPRYITQTRCRNVTNSRGEIVRECYQVRVDNPRYRQSQREAKRSALMRYQRAITGSLEELRALAGAGQAGAQVLNDGERRQLQLQIAELESAAGNIRRNARDNVFSF